MARLAALESYAILDTPPEPDFDEIAAIAAELCGASGALVNLVAAERQFIKAATGLAGAEAASVLPFCRQTVRQGSFLQISDTAADPRFSDHPAVTATDAIRFYAGAVLRPPGGYPIGTICVLDTVPRTLNDHQVRSLQLLARQAMAQIEMRKLIAERDASIEDLREANRRRLVLAHELSHRMKNTLAVVQSIVGQTFRISSSLEEARTAISARLAALARAQDLLIGSVSASTPVADAIASALVPHRESIYRIGVSGPVAYLNQQQTLGLTLAIHELATNAWKYGALASADGRVDIVWALGHERQFTFHWLESGGPPASAPARRGFGSRLLERVVAGYFSGSAQLTFAPSGIEFQMRGTLDEID
ncbi:GAF domain-containing protein [Aureimonas altamirensis]|uniref:HWE histidine kinase domain-containing protein n=1 Tax=Aureimonas altamirensis TaxID=370622 RepID=UPI001E415F69|nr:HWE histidine kinase domain-containing protein [Aureimonas altamirensis]UHD45547.1 GAF domain-containing protein [Aureimonas altamirensis]